MQTTYNGKVRVEAFLRNAHFAFEEHTHPVAYTAQAVAEAEHVPGKTVAKVVVAYADDTLVMTVLPAPYHLDIAKAAVAMGVANVRLAREDEFEDLFPDCDVGAMPPFGNLYGVRTYVDETLAKDEYIIFQAGSHTDAIRMKYADYIRAAQGTVADIAFHG